MRRPLGLCAFALVAGTLAVPLASPKPAAAVVLGGVIIDEVYGGGGAAGAPFNQDYIELYNSGATTVDLTGWSVQYGTTTGSTNSYARTALTGSIAPGGTYTVGGAGGAIGAPLPQPYVSGSLNLSSAAGKVALVNASVSGNLGCGADCDAAAGVIDFVGYGTANDSAGTVAPALSDTTSLSRDLAHTNTADNGSDFTGGAPTPVDPPDVLVQTIAAIQGSESESPFAGSLATTTGVVTAAYPSGGLNGYVLQTAGTGGQDDLSGWTTSDALFISSPDTVGTVAIGQNVTVTGLVTESFGLTQIAVRAGNATVLPGSPTLPEPITAAWPTTTAARESIESMLFTPTGEFTVTDTFSTNSFGEVGLATGVTPLIQPTDAGDFGSSEAAAVAADNAARQVTLDDGSTTAFLNSANQSQTPPYLSLTDPVRIGAAVDFNGDFVVDYRNGLWKLQPPTTVTSTTPTDQRTTFVNNRTETPDPSALGVGTLQVASFNVLNYFTTLGTDSVSCTAFRDRAGDGVTVSGGCDQRGAWDQQDLARQQVKIVNAVNTLDASVVGLMEIENSAALGEPADEALATLVDALNAAAGFDKWAYVPSSSDLPPASEQDVISNAIIYQPAEVTRLGDSRALGDQGDDGEPFSNAREPLGQAFQPVNGNPPFFVAVNHFKSKSSGATEPDTGQGAFNESRVAQATALRDWVPTVLAGYTTTPVSDVFLIGDFNSYSFEDPLQVLTAAGYANSNGFGSNPVEYTYSFGGLSGSLDHVLANESALARLTGSDIWNINSPESIALEYSRYNYHGSLFYDESPFRSSDHDPVIVAFDVPGADYNPVSPKRVFDTRPGQSPDAIRVVPKQQISPSAPLSVQMTDLPGLVPALGVGAVSLNVTVAGSGVPGFVTVYACGTRELISSVNFAAGQTVANAVITPVSATGNVCFFSNTPVDVVVDVNGWFPVGLAFNSVGPKRLFDTRAGQSPDALRPVTKQQVGGATVLSVRVTDIAGLVPAEGVGTVSLNVTATGSTIPGFVTVYPCGIRDEVSSVNFLAAQDVANAVIAPVSATGDVCFFSNTPVDLVVDINGWFPAGEGFVNAGPRRVFDTRPGQSTNAIRNVAAAKVGGTTVLEVKLTGLAGLVPETGVGAVSLNVTATNPDADGYITVYPCGPRSFVSSVNFTDDQTVANAVITPVSATGTVCFFSTVPTDIVVDVNGYFETVAAT